MTHKEMMTVAPGLYVVTWKDGSRDSLAAVGVTADGTRWLAPINWVQPSTDAWDLVASLRAFTGPPSPPPQTGAPVTRSVPEGVQAMARAGRKFDAIRLMRLEYGVSLKEAKDEVDAFMRNEQLRADAAALSAAPPADEAPCRLLKPGSSWSRCVRWLGHDGPCVYRTSLTEMVQGVLLAGMSNG